MYMSDFENYIKQIKKNIKINNNINYDSMLKKYHIHLINIFKLAYDEYNISLIKSNTHTEALYGKSFNAIPIIIRKHINKSTQFNTIYKFNIDKRVFQINFISNNRINIEPTNIKMIYMILFLCNHISNNEQCCQYLNVYIYLTPLKKVIPSTFKILDRDNINTAFTFHCLKENNIYIFREEEWFKCFIHECIHAFGFDFSQTYSNQNDIFSSNIIQKIFPISFDININESYVETFAIYINCIIKSFLSSYNKNSVTFVNKVLDKTIEFLQNEIYFSLFQSVKIMEYYNINYNDLYQNDKSVLHKYDENTCVFSYFIIKTILLYHFNDFFYWGIKYNKNIINFDCISNTNIGKSKTKSKQCFAKIKSFCHLIIKNYKNKSFINDINNIHNLFINTKTKTELHTSLRFSLYG